jgi:2-haloacid dehalogenase
VLAECLKGFGGAMVYAHPELSVSESVGDWELPDTVRLSRSSKHYKLAILSNIDDDLFARTNTRLGVQFDYIVTAQQVRSYKPANAHFDAILARSGLPKERILHVAQSLFHDHVPAKLLGFDSVWINRRQEKTGSGATPFARAQPNLEVPDLKSLAEFLC